MTIQLAHTDSTGRGATPITRCPNSKVVHVTVPPADTPATTAEIDRVLDRLTVHFPRGISDAYLEELQTELRALGLSRSALDAGASALIRGQTSAWFPRLGTLLKAIARDSTRPPLIYVASGSPAFTDWCEYLAERGDWLAAKAIDAGALLVPTMLPPEIRRRRPASTAQVECEDGR